ncbi:MAG: bifunctional glutamate N-acetyltransferase/amino-acid acetyltransferase ArgJ [Actinomycetes bacterium]
MSDRHDRDPVPLPRGFTAHVGNIGIKDTTNDICVLRSDAPCSASAVFTRSRFAGPSVAVSRRAVADGHVAAIAVISKNANVANGPAGDADAEAFAALAADAAGCAPADVLVASTGVIGRPYPMDRVRSYFDATLDFDVADAVSVATAMMTTDTHPKVAVAEVAAAGGTARIVGVAKGVGMIEPDMATMLAFITTDAQIDAADLDARFRRVVARTFNSLSVDSDTSTSDTAAVLANGVAGVVDGDAFESALFDVCVTLTRQLARDGEGATKLLTVHVDGSRDDDQARRVAKSVVNSPLVKTAVHGADPNWGRVAMAIGKCADDTDIDPERVVIRFGEAETYPNQLGADGLAALETYLRGDDITISVDLGVGPASWTVFGCDLSDGYVRINADYTT